MSAHSTSFVILEGRVRSEGVGKVKYTGSGVGKAMKEQIFKCRLCLQDSMLRGSPRGCAAVE